jgi:hypothetical protein
MMRCAVCMLLVPLILGGCATVMHGPDQLVPVTSSPAGARVLVDSVPAGVAPLLLTLPRARGHVVTLVDDSLGRVDATLTRAWSGWATASVLLNGAPVLIDLATGSAWRLAPDALALAFPGHAQVTPVSVEEWNLARGDRLRWLDGTGSVATGTVDSAADGRILVQPQPPGSIGGTSQGTVLPLETPRLAVYRRADAAGGGRAGLRYAALAASVPFMVLGVATGEPESGLFAGAFWSATVMPAGFLAGAAVAAPRWTPIEAFRAGKPLHVDDRVRLHTATGPVAGRLVDVEPAALVIRAGDDILRVDRSAIRSIQRSDGFDFERGLLRGSVVGALTGLVACARRPICNEGGQFIPYAAAGAMFGSIMSPALAPRRWQEVPPW